MTATTITTMISKGKAPSINIEMNNKTYGPEQEQRQSTAPQTSTTQRRDATTDNNDDNDNDIESQSTVHHMEMTNKTYVLLGSVIQSAIITMPRF
jgi:hypothetical protein